MAYIAIDIGASSGRHILADLVNGKIVTREIYRFPNGAKRLDNGSLIWDIDNLFYQVKQGLIEAGKLGEKIEYIAIDTWGVDYALLDENDNIIGNLYCYRDERGSRASEIVHKIIPFNELYERTGIQFAPFNTIYQLYDDLLTNKIKKAKTMLMLPDYLNFLLTGIKKQEYSNATTTGMVNCNSHTWDKEVLDKLGIPNDILLPLTQPASVVGKFKKEIVEEIGYEATVLLPATHDTASAIIAAPINFGEAYISSGTWSLLGVEEKYCHNDPLSMKYNYSNEGDVDYSFRYQKNIVGLWMIQQVRHELNDKYSFVEIAEMAKNNPTDKVMDVEDSCFLAPISMIDEIKKKIGDLSIGEIAYSIYHSLAICYQKCLKQLEELTNKKFTTLHIVGGGANNAFLNELTAKICNVTVYAGPSEATAIGNILMQLLATKKINNVREGRELVKNSFPISVVK